MLSFDENGWLFPDPLKNITHDIDSAEIDDLLKLAKEEDYWSAGIRETVKKRLEKDKDDVVKEITAYHSLDYYNDRDLHDIADGTPREEEINDYIYEQNYGTDKDYEDYDIDI